MKTYETPELELIRFLTEDIVTGSIPEITEDDDPDAGGTIEEP